MKLSKDIIAKKLASYEFSIERNKLKEFCLAIGETNPIYLDPQAAREAGFADTPLTPSFQTVFNFWAYPTFMQDVRSLGIDTDRLLHMKEDYKYLKPLYPGEKVQAEISVKDVKIGKMNMVSFQSIHKNQKGETCIEAEMSIVIRPD